MQIFGSPQTKTPYKGLSAGIISNSTRALGYKVYCKKRDHTAGSCNGGRSRVAKGNCIL